MTALGRIITVSGLYQARLEDEMSNAFCYKVSLGHLIGCLLVFFIWASPLVANGKVKNESTGMEYTDLQTAIDDANSGDTLKLQGYFFGAFVIDKSLTLKGSHDAVLDGNQSGRVLDIGEAGDITVYLEHLTIKNGVASTGAGIINIATLFLKHVKVENNISTGLAEGGIIPKPVAVTFGGGGIANYTINPTNGQNGPGLLTICDSIIRNNSAANGGSGGGISSVGAIAPGGTLVPINGASIYASLTIKDSKIDSNTSTSSFGGGLVLIGSNNEIIETEIESNTALLSAGGGIANESGSTTTLTKVKVEFNTAGVGAGIDNSSILTVNHSKIENNNAVVDGGGIQNEPTGNTALNDTKVSHNTAGTDGGGIFNSPGSSLTLNNTEVEHNSPNNIAP